MWHAGAAGRALGWMVDTSTGGRRIHHGGDHFGFGVELAYYPEDRLVLVNQVNRQNDILTSRYAADRVIPQLIAGRKPEMWPGEPFDVPPVWSPKLSPRLRGAVGTYRLPTGGELVVTAVGDDALSVSGRGQDAIDLLMPASDSVLRERRQLSEAMLAIIEATRLGDTTVAARYMNETGSAAAYTSALGTMFSSTTGGKLLRHELIGTVPSAYPRHSNNTLVRFEYERGKDVLRLKWVRGQRILQMGGGKGLVAPTLLRANATSSGLVGWHINWARTIRIKPQGIGSRVTALEFIRDGASSVVARRVTER